MTVAESWLAYRALVTGIADWGVQCSIAGVNPNDPRTWNSHLHVLNTSMPGTWQRYINDAALAARDQQSFTNPALLALAAEKTRVMVSTSRGIGTPGTTVTYSSRTMDSPMPIANTFIPNATSFAASVVSASLSTSAASANLGSTGAIGRAEQLLEEARGYRRQNKWSQAKDAYTQVTSILPGNTEATEGLKIATQKASMKTMAIVFPIMCGGMIAFVVLFLWFALSL
jgi:hypothetical protein